ncbi:Uncharacterised protein [Clostridium baratii]|uniref:DUF6877 family protein n=1 Tax=Clostridium baratii TaxID=1561 RepID=UPI0006C56F6A|nr:DUF6877 family protein [Clostridium baratii]CUP06463.1 Uncharacterised protein [Clostridium baratii]
MIKINNMKELTKYSRELPIEVQEDIQRRIGDWILSGGSYEDSYIKQQFRYVEKLLNSRCK